MPVGASALISSFSYLAVSRETATGTYETCTAELPFISCNLKTIKEVKVLEQIERSRSMSKTLSLGKVCSGDVEFYFEPRRAACGFLLQNWMGGTVTSATATGETTGAGAASAITHTFVLGTQANTYPSLSLNHRKGPVTSGRVWQYHGVKVNELMFSAELNEPLVVKANLVAMDSTQVSNDIEANLTFETTVALSFDSGRFSVEATFASLTSSSFWHVQSVEFGMNNAVKVDDESRRIGSDILNVLPAGMAQYTLNCKIRFDTTTAYAAMMNHTTFMCELEFLGETLPAGSAVRQGLKFQFPKVKVMDAGDPEIGGPDEIITSEVTFQVLRDDSSATGYAFQALLTNLRANYS